MGLLIGGKYRTDIEGMHAVVYRTNRSFDRPDKVVKKFRFHFHGDKTAVKAYDKAIDWAMDRV